jgi:hypothetical protein
MFPANRLNREGIHMKTKGWVKVLKFTYIQMAKAKSFVASMIIMVVVFGLMIGSANFLPGLLSSDSSDTIQITDEEGNIITEIPAFAIKKVYIYDGSGLGIDFSLLEIYEVGHELIDAEQVQAVMDTVTASMEAITLAVIEGAEHGGYNVKMSRPETTELITSSDCFELLSECCSGHIANNIFYKHTKNIVREHFRL